MRLIPKDDKYFTMLKELAGKVKTGGELFRELFADFSACQEYASRIKDVEIACDEITANIRKKLDTSFITPLDREDIFLLTSELDDVIDMITDVARRLTLYDVKAPRPDASVIADLLADAAIELADVFDLFEKRSGVREHCRNISQLENRADALYSEAIQRLFKEETNPIEVIKWMSLYEALENCIDRCKDVAEAAESVLVKNS